MAKRKLKRQFLTSPNHADSVKNEINEKAKSLINTIEALQFTILGKISQITHYHQHWIDNKDIRYSIFNRLNNILISTKLSLIFIETDLKNPIWWNSNFIQIKPEEMKNSLLIYEGWLKHHFGSSLFIQTENFSRCILRSLDPEVCNNSTSEFINIYNCLLSKVGLGDSESKILFNLLRLIRNTIHNDGVYRNKNSKNELVIYKGIEYYFIHDSLINFVTWDFLLFITNDIVKLIDGIILSEKVSDITFIISDRI